MYSAIINKGIVLLRQARNFTEKISNLVLKTIYSNYIAYGKFVEFSFLAELRMVIVGISPQLQYVGPRPNTEMSQDFRLWKNQVRQALRGVCALNFHHATEAKSTDASFRAAMQQLYVESHFTEFLACQAWRQAGLNEEAGSALQVLQQKLNAYDEPATDVAIVTDPAWWAIVGQAALVVTLLS